MSATRRHSRLTSRWLWELPSQLSSCCVKKDVVFVFEFFWRVVIFLFAGKRQVVDVHFYECQLCLTLDAYILTRKLLPLRSSRLLHDNAMYRFGYRHDNNHYHHPYVTTTTINQHILFYPLSRSSTSQATRTTTQLSTCLVLILHSIRIPVFSVSLGQCIKWNAGFGERE